jgi:hypothetical protein
MKTNEFGNLFLNIGDEIEVTMENFFWTIEKKNGKNFIDDGYDKEGEDGWNHAPTLTGTYCGENYEQPNGDLHIVKLRVSKPFPMSNEYGNYIKLVPSQIISIKVIKKRKPSVLDNVNHALVRAGV